MSYTYAALTSDELAYFALDKPILAAHTGLASLSDFQWAAGVSQNFGASAIDEVGREAYRGVDGYPGFSTEPNTSGTTFTWMLHFQAGIEFDAILFINHNLYSSNVTSLVVQIADDNGFSTNLLSILSTNPSLWSNPGKRVAQWDIRHGGQPNPTRYTDVEYVRLSFAGGGSYTPRLGQVVFARRTQLHHDPRNQWDPDRYIGVATGNTAYDGTIHKNTQHVGALEMDASFALTDTNRFNDVRYTFLPLSNYLANPFVWCRRPTSAPNNFQLMTLPENPDFAAPFFAWQARDFQLRAREQGPIYQETEIAT